MNKFFKLFGIIALVAVIGFSMVACDDSGGDDNGGEQGGVGVTVTVSIDKIDEKTFTITLEGAKWDSSFADGVSGLNRALFTEDTRMITVTLNSYGSIMTDQAQVTYIFRLENTSDTVGTFKLKEDWGYSNVTGTITLNGGSTLGVVDMFSCIDIDRNKTNTLIINPAKASITF